MPDEIDGAGSATPQDQAVAGGNLLAPVFDGNTGYVEIPDSADFSQPTQGALTVEAWIRPDSLAMPAVEASGYVHWLSKGEQGQQEWVARMYQEGNSEERANRISFYAFNLEGGLGAGSYFQKPLTPGTWLHVVGQIGATETFIFLNGDLCDHDPLSGYDIVPQHGTAPVRIGTRDFLSFFRGAICRVAIYGAQLSGDVIQAHYQARGSAGYDTLIQSETSLVSYWRRDQ